MEGGCKGGVGVFFQLGGLGGLGGRLRGGCLKGGVQGGCWGLLPTFWGGRRGGLGVGWGCKGAVRFFLQLGGGFGRLQVEGAYVGDGFRGVAPVPPPPHAPKPPLPTTPPRCPPREVLLQPQNSPQVQVVGLEREVTGGYKRLWEVMGGYGRLWGVMGGYGRLREVMGGYGRLFLL